MLVTVFVAFLGALTGNMTEVTYKIEGLFGLWDTVCHVGKVSWKKDGEEAGYIPSIARKEKEIKAGVQSCSDISSVFN